MSRFEDKMRELHGADVIAIEPDGSEGRRYRVVKPAAAPKVYPWYVRILAGLAMIPVALGIVVMVFGLCAIGVLIWITTKSIFFG